MTEEHTHQPGEEAGETVATDAAASAPHAPDEQPDAGAPTPGEGDAAATIEAILFASDSPLPAPKISMAAELPVREVRRAVSELNERYDRTGAAFAIEEIAGGYQMLTRPQYNDVLQRLLRAKSDSKLSHAAMETLAIIAYRQPIIRADIEAIRGVASGEVLRGLMEKNLVKIVARAEVLGRPMLYGTTRWFLEVFGLANIEDLPRVEELRSGAAEPAKVQRGDALKEQDSALPEPSAREEFGNIRRKPMGRDDVHDDDNFEETEEVELDEDFEDEDEEDFDDEDFEDESFDDDDDFEEEEED